LTGIDNLNGRNKRKMESAQPKTWSIIDQAIQENVWGIASSIDIYDCDPETIRSAEKIRQFVVELCDLIDMKRFQDTFVVNFGEDERVAGFSMVQLIETSLISGHFANLTNTAYLDVFSCKPYDPGVVEDFARAFFRGKRCITHVNLRR
jgi:S-adenosylmethionine/arginine decarboxylase-like enzyme